LRLPETVSSKQMLTRVRGELKPSATDSAVHGWIRLGAKFASDLVYYTMSPHRAIIARPSRV